MGVEAVSSQPVLEPGSMVDHFKVVRLAGQGGMGEVYLARDTKLGRKVAIKLVRRDVLGDGTAVERFLHEARTTAQFSHPHVVTVYAVGELEVTAGAARPYVALEWLEGQTLRDRLETQLPGSKEAMRLGLAIAEALGEAHAHGVLHRDLKPENVLIGRDGRLRVLDFGLAKLLTEDETLAVRHTEDLSELGQQSTASVARAFKSRGGLVGTPAYMAPEQWTGAELTSAADVWALGLILSEMLSGCHPYGERLLARERVFALGATVASAEPVPAVEWAEPVAPKLVELVRACLAKDPRQRPSAASVAAQLREMLLPSGESRDPEASPFRGLLPFNEEHAALFFGRDTEVDRFVERLRAEPVCPVAGPSGAGKSSFVQAGVIPRLREQGRWLVLLLRPGREPMEALAALILRGERGELDTAGATSGKHASARSTGALVGAEDVAKSLTTSPSRLSLLLQHLSERHDANVLLCVDQLEEVFTLAADEVARRAFVEAVCGAADDPAGRTRVVLTLRDDFIWRLAESEAGREALGHVTVLRSPGPEALAETLLGPVRARGYELDDETLASDMVARVQGEPAALALLQFTADRLWERRDTSEKRLRREAYDELGGVEGALAKQADQIVEGLDPEQTDASRKLLLRLVTAEGTRRVLPRAELLEGLSAQAEAALDRLIQGRVLVVRKGQGGGLVELVHESLVRTWHTLARWIDASKDELVLLGELEAAAALWDKRGRSEDEAWRGSALAGALVRLEPRRRELPELSRDFLAASERREHRSRRWRRAAAIAAMACLAAVAIVAVATTVLFVRKERQVSAQRDQANEQRALARGREAVALREAARLAFLRGSFAEARGKLRMALEAGDDAQARGLWWRLRREPLVWEHRASEPVFSIAWQPGTTRLAAFYGGALHFIDPSTQEERTVAIATSWGIGTVSFSATGKELVVAAGTQAFSVSPELGTVAAPVELPMKPFNLVSLSPDALSCAFPTAGAGANANAIGLAELAMGRLRGVLAGHTAPISFFAQSSDGELLVTSSLDGTVRLWSPSSATALGIIERYSSPVRGCALSSDGRLVASFADGARLRVREVLTGALLPAPEELPDKIWALGFDAAGERLAVATGDGSVGLVDVGSTELVAVGAKQPAPAVDIAISPDGRFLAAGRALSGRIDVWDLGATPGNKRRGHETGPDHVAASRTGHTIASSDRLGAIWLWDVSTGQALGRLAGHDDVTALAFSPDGRTLASAGVDHVIKLWDVKRHADVTVIPHRWSMPALLAFSPDGKLLASKGGDGVVRLLRMDPPGLVQTIRPGEPSGGGVAFSPDGRQIATGAAAEVRLFDVETGVPGRVLNGHKALLVAVAFGPDGKALASIDDSGSVWLWDLASGRGKVLGVLDKPSELATVAFDASGGRLVASGAGSRMWDVRSGAELARYDGWGSSAFAAADRFLFTVTSSSPSVWDTATHTRHWRGLAQLADPPALYTHRGWVDLETGGRPRLPVAGWRKAIEERASSARVSADGQLLCLLERGGALEMWDLARDELVQRRTLDKPVETAATTRGCVVGSLDGSEKGIRLYDRGGSSRLLDLEGAASLEQGDAFLSVTDAEILIPRGGKEVVVFNAAGTELEAIATTGKVTAATRTASYLAFGRADGTVEVRWLGARQAEPPCLMQDVPASEVATLASGPAGTLVGGYASGQLSVWDLKTGARLADAKLNGIVNPPVVRGDKIYATTDVGDFEVLDIAELTAPYCQVMQEVWYDVPFVWGEGRAEPRAAPAEHECAER